MALDTEKKPTESDNGCLAPILYWGSLFGIIGLGKAISQEDEVLARQIVIPLLLIWFFLPVIFGVLGKNTRDTAENIFVLFKFAIKAIAIFIVIGILAQLLPSSCMNSDMPPPADIYFRR